MFEVFFDQPSLIFMYNEYSYIFIRECSEFTEQIKAQPSVTKVQTALLKHDPPLRTRRTERWVFVLFYE